MKIALFGKNIGKEYISYLQLLIDKLNEKGIKINIYKPFFDQIKSDINLTPDFELFTNHIEINRNTDFLLSLGGDGTLLDTITLVRDSGIPILGINMGRLGFLASIQKEMIIPTIEAIAEGSYKLEKRTLISLETENNPFGEVNYALNEMTVYKQNPLSMLTIKVFVNDEFLNSYWSDGLIIATPTGSTAYSLSCGGPIITPDSQSLVITPIATHNLTVRPIIIPDTSIIRINVQSRDVNYSASLDSREFSFTSNTELVVKKNSFTINLVKMLRQNFFSTIRLKLLWGNDARN